MLTCLESEHQQRVQGTKIRDSPDWIQPAETVCVSFDNEPEFVAQFRNSRFQILPTNHDSNNYYPINRRRLNCAAYMFETVFKVIHLIIFDRFLCREIIHQVQLRQKSSQLMSLLIGIGVRAVRHCGW